VLCSFILWSYEFGLVCVCLVRAVQPDIISQEMRENLKLSLLFVDTRIAHSQGPCDSEPIKSVLTVSQSNANIRDLDLL
jgi:hypothetical protein